MEVTADILSLWTTIYKENTLKLHGNVGAFIFYTLTARGIDLQTAIVSLVDVRRCYRCQGFLKLTKYGI